MFVLHANRSILTEYVPLRPALWEYGANWPYTGEVDILEGMFCWPFPLHTLAHSREGVNNQGPNSMTLHTGPSCTMPTSQTMLGTFKAGETNCDSSPSGPGTGCSVASGVSKSYGADL